MKKTFLIIILKAILLSGCSKTSDDGTTPGSIPPASIEKNKIKGRITDSKGNPLANVKVVIEHTVYYNSYVYAMSDANGYYSATVPVGSWNASAQLQKNFQGTTYSFDLHPDIAVPFAGTDGAVRNFTWKLSGSKPGGGFYGSLVAVYAEPGSVFMLDEVELMLTPNGPLADGSYGQVITKSLTDVGGGEDGVADVPVGIYSIRARIKTTGRPLLTRIRNTGTYSDAVEGIFKPGYTGSTHYQIVLQVK